MISVGVFISSAISAPNGAAGFVRRLYENADCFRALGIELVGPFCGKASSSNMTTYANSSRASFKKNIKDLLSKTSFGTELALYLGGKRHAIEAVDAFAASNEKTDVALFNDLDVLTEFHNRFSSIHIPFISIEHDNGVFGQMLREVYPNIPNHVISKRLKTQCSINDLIVFVGKANQERFCEQNPNVADKTGFIHLGVDDISEVPSNDNDLVLPLAPYEFCLICTGTLCDRKNQLNIIRAISHPEVKGKVALILLGNGPDYEAAQSLVQQLGVSEYVSLPGSTNRVADYLRHADAYICASKSEGLPTAILEAMSLSLPIITTRAGSAEEAISNANGLIINDTTEYSIAAAISELLRMPNELKSMGEGSRELYETCYTTETMCNDLGRLILTLCGEVE